MRVAVIGKGNVGGGLADLWERAGHTVDRIGREGGDAGAADVVVIAVPGEAVGEALDGVRGAAGKTVIDTTNLIGVSAPAGFASNAEYVKSRTGGPTAKSFNLNFAALYGRLGQARHRPGNLWCGDDEARDVVEALNRDAGFEPIRIGGLDKAAVQEAGIDLVFAVAQGGLGPFVYRMAPPDQL